jgi:hypothetical protein
MSQIIRDKRDREGSRGIARLRQRIMALGQKVFRHFDF